MKPPGESRRNGRSGSGGSQPRRTPPPEGTGVEVEYLGARRESETPMVVELLDGRTVRGVIQYFDRDTIKLDGDSGPGLFVRKSDIRHIRQEDDD